jgi:hypothetical protein
LIQPLKGSGLPPPAGSPAVRDKVSFIVAFAFGEEIHRSTIMPPSPAAIARNRCDLPVLLKYKDLYFGASVSAQLNSRSSEVVCPYQTLTHYLDEPKLSGDSSFDLILGEFEYDPLH